MMRTYIVYKYTSPSGKHYIGKTYNEQMRKYHHKREASKGNTRPLYRAMRKYGIENFTYEVIVKNVPSYMINAFEKYWINFYNAVENGYNCTIGGDGLQEPSQETRVKIGNTSKGRQHTQETKNRIGVAFRGKKLSEEHIAKLKKPKSEEHKIKAGLAKCKKVQCVETGIIYDSIRLANVAVGFNVQSSNITSVCKGRRNTAANLHWRYLQEGKE